MSDSENRDLFDDGREPRNELLDELGSIKALLDEEIERAPAVTSINEINSVKEYMLLKQKADAAGLSLEAYLQQLATEQADAEPEEGDIPMLDEVVDLGNAESLGTPAGNEPLAEAAIPTLDEVYNSQIAEPPVTPSTAEETQVAKTTPNQGIDLEELEQLVHQLVERKLRELRPQLEKQIFDDIRNGLPYDIFR